MLGNGEKKIDICDKSETEIEMTNLSQIEVTTADMLQQLMSARKHRASASTVRNERSNRSHAMTSIEIVKSHANRSESLVGNIDLVDLAGSESAGISAQMQGTRNINTSLSALKSVILAILEKRKHILYRESKLTRLLKPSLDSNSKTLILATVSPYQQNFSESVNVLRFASNTSQCNLGRAKRNKQPNVSSQK